MEGAGYRVSTEDAFFSFCLCETPPSGGLLLSQALQGLWEPSTSLTSTPFP